MEEHEGQGLQSEDIKPIPDLGSEALPSDGVEEEVPKEPRPRRLRRALLWILSLVVIFAAGVILTWAVRIRPQAAQLVELQSQVASLQEQLDDQKTELGELRPLVEENALLAEDLVKLSAHLDLLVVLVDVTTAQLALAQEDDIAARAALTGTEARLNTLEAGLEGPDAAAVAEMRTRLQLVLDGVETDNFAARRDLEIMANDLLSLERVLFGE
jgi:cell division protein FtsL